MPIISYAQNFEDIMLWRALKHVENGFYIDIGANDPQIDSVTKLFYDKGWHGINIEPLTCHIEALQRQRTRDMNIACAIADAEGETEIWQSEIRGLATLEKSVVDRHQQQGLQGEWIKTPVRRLNKLLEESVADITDIHFLKIDVEGAEKTVLASNDWHRYRPWIVVVESTLPLTEIENHHDWEFILLENNYAFIWFDGLNRYYISHEHRELSSALRCPPNVFDDFVRIQEINSLNECVNLDTKLNALMELNNNKNREITLLAEQNTALKLQVRHLETSIEALFTSYSWKLTAPLRKLARFFSKE